MPQDHVPLQSDIDTSVELPTIPIHDRKEQVEQLAVLMGKKLLELRQENSEIRRQIAYIRDKLERI